MPGVNVQLQIFSGKPDPTFDLDANETQNLAVRVSTSLVAAQPQALPEVVLGYRGFQITADVGPLLPSIMNIWADTLAGGSDAGEFSVKDVSGCEDFLLTVARQRGFGDLLDHFGAPGGNV